jgi:alpha-glucosidase (family GH31 glycosyl hydrolase)
MFVDFPTDESMFHVESQFMFGDNILVAPKLNSYKQVAYLPYQSEWYNFNTKLLWTECSPVSGVWPVMEMPVFYRAGSILPILLHENALSLLRAINNNIALEIYPTSQGSAEGNLVLDDGWSTKTDVSRYVFNYVSSGLLSMTMEGNYKSGKAIASVSIYGVKSEPLMVVNLTTQEEVSFVYDSKAMSVQINALNFSLDQDNTTQIDLVQLTWQMQSVVA